MFFLVLSDWKSRQSVV